MKVFLAIDLNEALQNELAIQIQPIVKDYPEFTWIPPEKYHITVQYIGGISNDEKLQKLHPIIEELTYDIPKFTLTANMADILINTRITLYVEFHKNNHLEKIVKRVQKSLGTSPNYRYMPHVTIAKYKIPSKQQYLLLKKKLQKLPVEVEVPVDSIFLYESILARPHPIYKNIMEYPLAEDLK